MRILRIHFEEENAVHAFTIEEEEQTLAGNFIKRRIITG